ncbi:MAG: hypothetical protein ACXQTL_03915 [Methanosarcinales archaeon]
MPPSPFTRYCKYCHHLLIIRDRKTTNMKCPECGEEYYVVWEPKLVKKVRER